MDPSRRSESTGKYSELSWRFARLRARHHLNNLCNVAVVARTTRSGALGPRRLRAAVCVVALGMLAILSAGCSGGSAPTSGGTSRPPATTNTASSSTTGNTTTACQLVRTDLAVVGTNSTLPIADGQQLLVDAEASGNHKLATEALALASASHTLDAQGVAHALQQMSDTCHSLGH
jgi:hypothetical protein